MVELADLMEIDEQVRQNLGKIAEYDPEELLQALPFPQLPEVHNAVAMTIDLARKFKDLPLQKIPPDKLQEINTVTKEVLFRFGEIKEQPRLSIKDLDGLLTVTINNCQTFQNVLIPLYSYLLLSTPDFRMEQVDHIVTSLQGRVAAEIQDFKNKKDELDSVIEVARDTAAQAGVAQHAGAFREIGEEHARASKKWLIAASTLITITMMGAIALLYLWPAFGELREAPIIQRIIAKLIILSSLYYGVAWSAKNYRIHRHLSVVNMHRHNALKTFEAFIKAASGDLETKSAVLLETTRSIFAPTNTGYLGADEENSDNRIIEIVKTVGTSVSSK
jgi:hypothetical protein